MESWVSQIWKYVNSCSSQRVTYYLYDNIDTWFIWNHWVACIRELSSVINRYFVRVREWLIDTKMIFAIPCFHQNQ